MKTIRAFLLLPLIFISHHVFCQVPVSYFSAAYHKGFVLVHSKAVRAVKESYPQGFQLDFGKHATSKEVWDACNCYPRSGISLTIWDFDNPRVLGYGATAVYYLQPVFRINKNFSLSVRGGMGLSYQSNPHDAVTNPDNQSYSTSLAIPLELGTGFHYQLSDLWQVEARLMYKHISNGGMRQPNKGINWPTAGMAISRYLHPISFPERVKSNWKKEEVASTRTDLLLFGTYQEPADGIYMMSGGAAVKHARRVGRLSNVSAGCEWMYDTEQARLSRGERHASGHHLGGSLGHEFILGRFLFSQELGVYLLTPSSRAEDLYQRYGLYYRFNSSLIFGASLKAHAHVADFFDLRLGYSF